MTIASSSSGPNSSTASLHHIPWIPPRTLEYAYFLTIAYSITSTNLGIEIPLFAAGMLVLLAGICVNKAGRDIIALSRPILLLLAALLSFIVVQIVFHGASILDRIDSNFYSLGLRYDYLAVSSASTGIPATVYHRLIPSGLNGGAILDNRGCRVVGRASRSGD